MLGTGVGLFDVAVRGKSAAAVAPVISGIPTISGTPAVGQVLTATPSSVTGAPVITRTWQWHRNGVDIPGATSSTYTVVTADVSAFLSVTQIETNGFGFDFAVSNTVLIPYSPFTGLLGYQFSIDPSVIGTLFTDTAGTTPVTAPGDLVACVRDPFTNAIVATQATAGNRPIYQVDAGGKAYLQLSDGTTNRWLVTPTLPYSTNGFNRMLTIFAVQQDQRPGTNSHLQDWSAGNGRMRWLAPLAGNTHSVDSRGTAAALAQATFTGTVPIKMLLGAYATIPNDNVVLRRDKAQVAQNTADQGTGNYSNSTITIGATTSGVAPFIGRLYSYIMAANATTDYADADILPVENYAEARLNPNPAPAAPVEADGGFRAANQNWEGYTATFSERDEGFGGSVGYPNLFRSQALTTSGAANRVNADAGTLNGSEQYSTAFRIGSTARVYRVTDGVMNLVRTGTVTDAKIGRWLWLQFQTSGVNDNRVIDGTSYRFEFPNFSRPNVPYWFRVAAVGSDGLSGAWSDPVAYTPTAVNTAANNNPNTPRSFNRAGSGGALGAPTGLTIVAGNTPRTASMTWTAVAGAEGYIVELTYYNPATEHATPAYLELSSDPTPILTGDLVILEKQFTTLDDTLYASRIFGAGKPLAAPPLMWSDNEILKRDGNDWAYVPYGSDKPPVAVGDHFFRRTAAAGQSALMNFFWHSGSGQSFYSVLKVGVTYRLSITMRASSTVNVVLTQSGAAATGITGTTFSNVGSTFQTYTHDMVPTIVPTGTQPYDWKLSFTAGGSPINVDVAHFKIEEVGASSNVLAATPPASNGYLRDHTFIKPGANNRSIKRMITNDAYGFKAFYDACVATNNRPWFQLEWNTPKQDFLDFVAYLAAPNGSHPMADLRLASGIPEPWTTTFPNMLLENGNEAWNNTSGFWIFPFTMTDSATAQVYNRGNIAGLFWQMISNWMKESPYWSTLAPKLTQHAGGWAISAFGEDAYRYYPDAKEVSVAAYNGGWDNGVALVAEKGISFNSILADAVIVHLPRASARVAALKTLCTSLGRNYGTDIRYTIYEAGPGYQLNGLNGVAVTAAQVIEQEVVMKSRAGAASTVDNMLTFAVQDFKGYNYFTLDRGDYWKSHASPNDGDQEYMAHALVRIIHDNIAPARVFGMDTTALGTKSVTLEGGGSATINQIGAYQLRNLADPSKRMLVLINRNIDPSQLPVADPLYSATPSGSVLFNIQTIWQSATSLRAWTAGIGPFRQHNRYPVGQRRNTSGGLVSDPLCVAFDYSPTTLSVPSNLQNFPINASVGATSGGLPAGNCLILLFEGVT